MHIVSKHKSLFYKGEFVFEDGPIETLRFHLLQGQDRYIFTGKNSYLNLESLRRMDDRTKNAVDLIDAQAADLHTKLNQLHRDRRELIAKGYPKFKKVYKWDLDTIPAE